MVVMLVPLIFVTAALLATFSLAATWAGYSRVVAANIAALREFKAERSFFVRVASFGSPAAFARHPALRRAALRTPAKQLVRLASDLREAA